MLTIDGKQFRNLEEQVRQNQSDIKYILEEEGVLNQFGIKVIGEVTSSSQLPDPNTYIGEYGDAYAVGTETPYELYIFTRQFSGNEGPIWFNIGRFPVPGPTGATGPKGATGPQGTRGSLWNSGSPISNPNKGDQYVDNNGQIYQYNGSGWIATVNIKGPQGIQGPQGAIGPQGPQGIQGPQGNPGTPGQSFIIAGTLTNTDQLPDADTAPQNEAYLVGSENNLYVIVGTTDKVWTDVGPFEGIEGPQGATGPQGPIGPQGPQGIPGPQGPQGEQGLDGSGANPNLLINGDFRVNQRGQEEYGNATQYTVDRWQLSTQTNANISFNATTKTLSNTGTSWGYFVQRLEPNDVDKIWGKTWTFSAKVNGNIYSKTFTAPSTAPISSQGIAPTLVCIQNLCQVRLFYYANSGTIGFTFDIHTGSVTLEYAKLELGSVATPFNPRPYAEELALCQRYYINLKNASGTAWLGNFLCTTAGNLYVTIPLPTKLRINPTITITGSVILFTPSFTTVSLSQITLIRDTNAGCSFITTPSSSITSGTFGNIRNADDGSTIIELDAEIY